MTIFTGDFTPYNYVTKYETLKYVKSRTHDLKKSLRLVEKDNEHLTIRCPLSGDYLDILGTVEELDWLHNELIKGNWYRTN